MTYSTYIQQERQRAAEREAAPKKCPHCKTPINQNLTRWDRVRYHCGSDRCRKAMSRYNIAHRKRVERDEASLRIDTYAANLPETQQAALLKAKKLLMQADYEQGHNTMLGVIEVIEAQRCQHDRISVLLDNASAAKRRADKADEYNQQLERLYKERITELEAELLVYQLLENAVHNIATRQLEKQPDPQPPQARPVVPEPDPDRAATLATLAPLGIKPVEEALAELYTEGDSHKDGQDYEDTEQ